MARKTKHTTPTEVDPIDRIADQIHTYQHLISNIVVTAIIVLGAGLLFSQYQQRQNTIAHDRMYQAVRCFEQEKFLQALYGDETCTGFVEIIKKYPWTQAANLANFYAGASYMHQGSYELAIQHLKRFKAKDWLLQARAWSLIGDAYTEQEDYAQAIRYYQWAAEHYPNKVFTPVYLHKAALVHEASHNLPQALACYQRIVKQFPEAEQYGEACKHVARLSTLIQHGTDEEADTTGEADAAEGTNSPKGGKHSCKKRCC